MIWSIPETEKIGFRVSVLPDPDLLLNYCEYNCDSYISRFGGEKIEGVYVLKHVTLPLYQIVKHFIVFDGEDYIDVTPFEDNRDYNWFLKIRINTYNSFVQSLEYINKQEKLEEQKQLFYVYCYIDPTNDLPFYVGKGKQMRAFSHIKTTKKERKNKNTTRFLNKLESMINDGVQPKVIYLAQNIENEEQAYKIEESFIKQYGRKGYEENGILLNVCEGSRPPNHKGKTYKEIYGNEAETQRKKRHILQLEAGGWFKGQKHSKETKEKIREKNTGFYNSNCSGISEEYLLEVGGQFCDFFNNEISAKKWKWWCDRLQIPCLRKTFRFDGKDLLKVFKEKFNAKIKFDSMLWFYDPDTKKTWRCLSWELEFTSPPNGFIRGRGINTSIKKQ